MKKIRKLISKYLVKYRKQEKSKGFKRDITRHYNKLAQKRKLNKAQAAEVQEFYKGVIGREIDLLYHEYFYSRTGFFTKYYVPIDLYHFDLVPKANHHEYADAYRDKNLQAQIFPGENVVRPILQNMNGYFYYQGTPVTRDKAIELCSNMENVIIKPARLSKGNGVQLFSVTNGKTTINDKTIEQLLDQYKEDYLIQGWIHQHKDIAALNPTSVNTLRILTYRSDFEVLLIYSVIRIGRSGAVIDNQCAGGISTNIDSDGRLGNTAFGGMNASGTAKTDTGVTLEGYQLPSYDKAVEFVKRLHTKLPYFKIVGWDVAIEENGEPILIEYNVNPGLSQSAFKSGMGEHTERIIRELWPRPNSWFQE